ncbi:transposase family protein [Streptomyces sp. NPDC088745]|uniref:transposase family protein n=1 Tax=Streptomyces sp. NPDC088745 TaxID=3365884 RepID=UPI00380E0DC0
MDEVLLQLDELLFSSVEGVVVESAEVTDTVVRVEARTTAGGTACPGCGCWSRRMHGSYLRFPRDLPTAGKPVVVSLRVQRFVCAQAACPRKTFAEQVPGLTRRFGRRTERLRSALVAVALALAGRAGARMTDIFQIPVSRKTLLRLIASLQLHPAWSHHTKWTRAASGEHRHLFANDSRRGVRSSEWTDTHTLELLQVLPMECGGEDCVESHAFPTTFWITPARPGWP